MELLDDKMRVWIDSAKFVKPIPGVYVFYNRSKEVIFIGETKNLEETFTKYVEENFEENECKQRTQYYLCHQPNLHHHLSFFLQTLSVKEL